MSRGNQKTIIVSLVVIAQVLGACKNDTEFSVRAVSKKGDTVAKIGATEITAEDIKERLSHQPSFWMTKYSTPEGQKDFLEVQIRQELLAQEAIRQDLQNQPEVRESIKKMLAERVLRNEFQGKNFIAAVNDADLQAYYDQNKEQYNREEAVQAEFTLTPFGSDKAASLKKAREASQTNFAKTDFITKEEATKKFGAKAAETLWNLPAVNKTSNVVEGTDGYYMFRKNSVRAPHKQDFASAKEGIRRIVANKKRGEAFTKYIDELKKKANVVVYEDKLSGALAGQKH